MKKLIILIIAVITSIVVNAGSPEIHPDCIRSDVNGDSVVTQADVQAIIDYIDNGGVLNCHQVMHADVNRDWVVDDIDAGQIQAELFNPPQDPEYAWGDINGDRIVDAIDFEQLTNYVYGHTPFMPSLGFDTGDISGDGQVNQLDVDIFSVCDQNLLVSPFRSSPY